MLDTMREECERRVLEMKGEEKRGKLCLMIRLLTCAIIIVSLLFCISEEAEVRQENRRLMAVIDKMK